jgi:flagellar basal body-associated protein FliL
MSKKIFSMLVAVLVMLSFTFCYSTLALAEKKQEGEQFGQTKEEATPQTGEAGPLKENICKNPKLCDSIEIDLLNNLSQA